MDPVAAAPMNTLFTGKATAAIAAMIRHPGRRAENQTFLCPHVPPHATRFIDLCCHGPQMTVTSPCGCSTPLPVTA